MEWRQCSTTTTSNVFITSPQLQRRVQPVILIWSSSSHNRWCPRWKEDHDMGSAWWHCVSENHGEIISGRVKISCVSASQAILSRKGAKTSPPRPPYDDMQDYFNDVPRVLARRALKANMQVLFGYAITRNQTWCRADLVRECCGTTQPWVEYFSHGSSVFQTWLMALGDVSMIWISYEK